jgi:hypothetical protein
MYTMFTVSVYFWIQIKVFNMVLTSCYYFVSISGYVNEVKDVLFSILSKF